MSINKMFKGKVDVEISNNTIHITRNKNLVSKARIAYIELSHRKLALDFSEEYDAISEVYDSYYASFNILRDLLKGLSQNGEEGKLLTYISEFVNKDLRGELTKFQSRYRTWLEKKKKTKTYSGENDAQKKYPKYEEIVMSMKKINTKAIEVNKVLSKIAYGGKND